MGVSTQSTWELVGDWATRRTNAGCSNPDTTCLVATNQKQPSTTDIGTDNNSSKLTSKMNQAPVRPQRGLVPFSKEAKEPFFSSTWDEFDQMRNQMMEKNHGFWDKVDQDMKVKYELTAQDLHIILGIQIELLNTFYHSSACIQPKSKHTTFQCWMNFLSRCSDSHWTFGVSV